MWHTLDLENVFTAMKTSGNGLSSAEAESRLAQHGPNKVEEAKEANKLKLFIDQFKNPLIYVLIIAGIVTIFLEEYVDAGVIFLVVTVNAVVGFVQEYKAGESAKALKKMLASKATVLRDGRQVEVDRWSLVPGDIVIMSTGSKVPADLRIFKAVELSIDESVLTGESIPVQKSTNQLDDAAITSDQKNMAFLGTHVVSGRGMGVVVETGSRTVMGGIARDVKDTKATVTPLQAKFNSFAKAIGIMTIAAASMLFLLGILMGESVVEMFKVMIAATVATIPEGLPIVVTIAMAIGVSRMARRNAIIKKLPAVETLGSTTVICSDKTGTLTKNEMTVKKMWAGGEIISAEGEGYSTEGYFLSNEGEIIHEPGGDFRVLLKIGVLCNNSGIQEDGIVGMPTDASILVAAIKAGLNPDKLNEENPRVNEIPFSSERKLQTTANDTPQGRFVYCIGAPDIILSRCERILMGGEEKALSKDLKDLALGENAAFASSAYRVLGAAYKRIGFTEESGSFEEKLVFCGLFAIIDPPRPEAITAVKGCDKAGIRVVMITGDHTLTAVAIAKQMGIGGQEPKVLSGKELAELSDEELYGVVNDVSVYARVTSNQKLRIVQQLIRRGEIVAVTGDGVNDAPALKAAHIGVAMGKTGSDVAKESAAMILSDDNFASIFAAVEEGRFVYSNIKKVTFFLIPTGIAAIVSIMGSMLMGLKVPYLATQLLWINIVTNGLQDVALAFEPGEKHLINRKPRNPKESIMSRLMIERTIIVALTISAGVLLTYLISLSHGDSLEKARTVAVTTMVLFQFFHVWNSRSEFRSITQIPLMSNPFLFYSLAAASLAMVAFLYAPPLQRIFHTVPLTPSDWFLCLVVASSIIVVVEAEKRLRQMKGSRGGL